MTQVAVAAALALTAAGLARAAGIGLERDLLVAAARAAVQLTVVGLAVALVLDRAGLAGAFVALMLLTASLTSARPSATRRRSTSTPRRASATPTRS